MAGIELRGVTKVTDGVTILDHLDLAIADGEILAVIGPSGSGKTTLLRLIAGLERPTSGEVSIGGREVDTHQPWSNRVAMSFQDDALYEHLNVGGNLAFPLRIAGTKKSVAGDTIRRRLGPTGVEQLWSRLPGTLSGGERGLVATTRAITRGEVAAILLDEPLARADPRMRSRFRGEVRRVHSETGVTTVLATNDQEEALALGQRVAVIDGGRLQQVAEPWELYRHPANVVVAGFVGSPPMNLFPAVLRSGGDGWWAEVGSDRLRLEGEPPVSLEDQRVVVGLHPAELTEATPSTPFERVLHVTVGAVEPTGRVLVVRFGLGSVGSVAYAYEAPPDRRVEPGDRRELTWTLGRLRLFSADSGETIPM